MITKVFVGGSNVDKSPIQLYKEFTNTNGKVNISVSSPNQKTTTIDRPVYSEDIGDYTLFGVYTGTFTINMGSVPQAQIRANLYHVFTGLNANYIKGAYGSQIIEYCYYHKPGSNLYVGIITANGIRVDNVQLSREYLDIIKPEYLTEVIAINGEMTPGKGLVIEWTNGKTSATLKGGYTQEQQITTGSYIMEVSANADNGVAGFFVITYNNNASMIFQYDPVIIGNPISCNFTRSTSSMGFKAYIDSNVQPQIDNIEQELEPISSKLDIARSIYVSR